MPAFRYQLWADRIAVVYDFNSARKIPMDEIMRLFVSGRQARGTTVIVYGKFRRITISLLQCDILASHLLKTVERNANPVENCRFKKPGQSEDSCLLR
jgi:hypothetical protein